MADRGARVRGGGPTLSCDDAILGLVTSREGHFRLESGHHGRLWLDLDGLFVEPARVAPLVDRLARLLRAYEPTAVCGPLLGGAFLAQALSAALQLEFLFTERVTSQLSGGSYRAEYRLPKGLRDRVRGKRVAVVDDVISAGSATRGTHAALKAHGARTAVVAALLVFGSTAARFFEQEGVPVTSVAQRPYELWLPEACPLCVARLPLEDVP